MDNRYTTFGLSRKNAGAWIAVFLMLSSVIVRIVYYALGGTHGLTDPSGQVVKGIWVFLSAVLPILAGAMFIIRLLLNGRDRLYKTGLAVLLGAAFFIARIVWMFVHKVEVTTVWHLVLCIILYLAAFFIWDLTVNGAKIRTKIPAILVFSLPLIVHLFVLDIPRWIAGETGLMFELPEISVLLMMASLAAASVSLEKITGETFRPRRGDRPDGRLVRSLDPINGVAIYIMPTRNGASTYFRDSIECSKMEEYIRKKRAEGLVGFGTLHVIAAAYVRVISQHPACNRFISGQKIYSRDGEIELALAVKKDMKADAPETIIKVCFSPEDTAEDVFRKFNEQVLDAKDTPLDSSFDNLAGLINAVPGVLKKFLVWFLKTLDYFGKLPRFLMRLSPFHGSVFVTDLGSLGIPPVFHHLYDFGNIPAFIGFGSRRTQTVTGDDGTPVRKKFVDYTIVTDERICDGFYYASAFKSFRRYLNNPEKLDVPPEEVKKDVF
ncbi:MAG: hypothetical protein K6F68_05500 [Clostridiales bacterium]|nr:hypothetical protein [Clostridiales bacterium]